MKRGISPLVATTLIIGVVAVMTIVIVFSLQNLVNEETGDIQGSTEAINYCAYGVDLDIETPCEYKPTPMNTNLSIKLKNYENGDISGFIFKITEAGSTYIFENNTGIPGLGSRRYFLGFSGNYSNIEEIVVIPKISLDAGEAVCDPILLSMDRVNKCCLDLDGDKVDSCDNGDPLDEDGKPADCDERNITVWKLWSNVIS